MAPIRSGNANTALAPAVSAPARKFGQRSTTVSGGSSRSATSAGAPALVADLDEPHDTVVERWPTFLEGAGTAGARAVFAFPLRIGAITLGALDLYRDRPGELDGGQLAAALLAADAAAIALLHLDAGRDEVFADDLDAGRTYHLQVHQATGMVQSQLDVQTDEALLMLRSRAFATDRPLAAVATWWSGAYVSPRRTSERRH